MSIPLYLFKGPEFGEKNDAIQGLKNQAKKKFSQIEFNSFYAMETSVNEVMMRLSNGSLFSDAKFFIFKNVEQIKTKDEIQIIENWAKAVKEQNSEDSILVLVTDENSVDKKLESIVPKENVKMFWEMYEDKKLPWLLSYFSKNGFKIHEDAANEILNLIENNTLELKNKCSTFFVCFPQDHIITVEDVEKVLSHDKEENSFTLFEAIANKDNSATVRLERGLEILQKIRSSGSKDANSIGILGGLLYSFRQLRKWQAMQQSGESLESFTKTKQVLYRNASKIWNLQQTQRIIALLSSTDMKIRTLSTALEQQLLETMLYQIILKNGSPLFEYQED